MQRREPDVTEIAPSRQTRYLTVDAGSHGDVRIPLGRVTGARDGPVLVVMGGMHGCEFDGIEAVRRFFHEIDANHLAGSVITIPCFNTPAFFALRAHVNPLDGENPSLVFPGSADGSASERMAHAVWSAVGMEADVVIDVHGGDLGEELAPYAQVDEVGVLEVDVCARNLVRIAGMPYVVTRPANPPPRQRGSFRIVASEGGRPAVLLEAGSHGKVDETSVRQHLRALRNIAVHLGMIEGTLDLPSSPMLLDNYAELLAPCDGIWRPEVAAGEYVTCGQKVGEVQDFFGESIADVTSETNGVALVVAAVPSRRKGDLLMEVGRDTVQD